VVKRRTVAPYRNIIENLGAKVLDITVAGSTHYKIEIEIGGRRRFFVASSTPSDRRSIHNWKSDVRKWINNLER
jgi:hypothetical protein